MKVCSIIVTYGDRIHLLEKVVESVLNEGIDKVIIVDNHSHENSRKRVLSLAEKHKGKIATIVLQENTGSAGGFRIGMEEFFKCGECEFGWLLDDDNKPEPGALEALKSYWSSLNLNTDNKGNILTTLSSFRQDREVSRLVNMGIGPEYWSNRKDQFLGFHFFDINKRIGIKFRNFFRLKKRRTGIENKCKKRMLYDPYSGFFFHKSLLKKIGYPSDDFYIYGDDREFTGRIPDIQGEILLVPESVVTDIDNAWQKRRSGFRGMVPVFLRINDSKRLFLNIKNDFRRKKKSYDNELICLINKRFYLTLNRFYSSDLVFFGLY